MLSILYGILSAATWGAGDFIGGIASKRTAPTRVLFLAELAGMVPFTLLALILREPMPPAVDLLIGAGSSLLGLMGLLFLYSALASSQMTIAAPVSALFAAVLPVVVGAITEGLPTLLQLMGFGLALTAVWLISQGNQTEKFRIAHLTDLRLPILAGIGFGSYFIFIHNATQQTDTVLWPMIVSRLAGTVLLILVVLARRETLAVPRSAWTVVFFNATLDVGGNFFYIMASQLGRLDTAAVLSSLYPGATVLLAWLLLKERIAPRQWIGIAAALAAIVLFTL